MPIRVQASGQISFSEATALRKRLLERPFHEVIAEFRSSGLCVIRRSTGQASPDFEFIYGLHIVRLGGGGEIGNDQDSIGAHERLEVGLRFLQST